MFGRLGSSDVNSFSGRMMQEITIVGVELQGRGKATGESGGRKSGEAYQKVAASLPLWQGQLRAEDRIGASGGPTTRHTNMTYFENRTAGSMGKSPSQRLKIQKLWVRSLQSCSYYRKTALALVHYCTICCCSPGIISTWNQGANDSK